VEATGDTVVRAYETKITDLEKIRARMAETLTRQAPPKQVSTKTWNAASGHLQAAVKYGKTTALTPVDWS